MICNKCGAYNEDGQGFCKECGAKLSAGRGSDASDIIKEHPSLDFTTPSWIKASSFNSRKAKPEENYPDEGYDNEPVEDVPAGGKFTSESDDVPADEKYAPSSDDNDFAYERTRSYRPPVNDYSDVSLYEDEDEPEPVKRKIVRPASYYDAPAQGGSRRANDGQQPQRYAQKARPTPVKENYFDKHFHSRNSRKGLVRFLIIAGVVVVLFVVGLIYVNANYGGSVGAFFSGIFSGDKPRATAQEVTIDDKLCTRITVYSKGAKSVRFTADNLSSPIEKEISGGVAIFDVVQTVWIPTDPGQEAQLSVTPALTSIDKDGKETAVEMEPITITIPKIEMTLTTPAETMVTTDSAEFTVAGTLSVPDAQVYVNGTEIPVNADGSFNSIYTLETAGPQTITIEAKRQRYASDSVAVDVNFNKKDVAVAVNEDTSLRTAKTELTIKGTTEVGATITVDSTLTYSTPTVDEQGNYSFTLTMNDVGLFDVKITASKDGGFSSITIGVEHIPNVDEYTRKAYKMDYPLLKANAEQQKGFIYRCDGKITEIVQSDPYMIVKLNVGSGEEQIILIEYHGTTTLEVGKSYSIYGDVVGKDTDSGLPKIYGWFAYTK